MAMKFRCPECHELFSAQEEMAGAQITCPMCFAKFELPATPKRATPPRPQKSTSGNQARQKHAPAAPSADNRRRTDAARPPPEVAEQESFGLTLPVVFRQRNREEDNELDMTPMVDVTFLLLIFFMVTAAFGLQKSYDVPAPDDSRPSARATSLEEIESDPTYVVVRIDQYDTFHVGAATWEAEQEAPSRPDLLAKLRQAKEGSSPPPTRMLIMANEEATNGKVVAALDAGASVGMEDVKLLTVPALE